MEFKNCVIYVDGRAVGYQFAKKSMGSRKFTGRTVEVTTETALFGTAYIPFLKRTISVKRLIASNNIHWESAK